MEELSVDVLDFIKGIAKIAGINYRIKVSIEEESLYEAVRILEQNPDVAYARPYYSLEQNFVPKVLVLHPDRN